MQARLDRALDRLGPRYLSAFWAFVAGSSFLLTGVWAALLGPVSGIPIAEMPPLIALALALEIVCRTALWLLVYRPMSQPIWRWLSSTHDAEPEAAWEAMRLGPRRGFFHSGWAWVLFVPLPVLVFARRWHDLTIPDVVAGVWASAVAVTFNLLLAVLLAELVLRPVRVRIWPHLQERVVHQVTYPLSQRLSLALPMLALLTAFAVAYAATLSDPSLVRFGAYLTVGAATAMSLTGLLTWLLVRTIVLPVQELTRAVARIHTGDLGFELVPTSEDELGVLTSSLNQMSQGLAERGRLQSAFGSYVDPMLAERLLAQGHELFEGESAEVTVLFVDVRDFTPFAEAHTPEESVARLNDLFDQVVPVLHQHNGHANKFLGDGVLAVFGVPEQIEDHAGEGVAAAVEIHRQVRVRFGTELRIGIGINTGSVIAGTVGGGGKLEFTLIGDAVNVAARVEQLTKETADPILLTQATVDALSKRPAGLEFRGSHRLKGKTAPTDIYALNPYV